MSTPRPRSRRFMRAAVSGIRPFPDPRSTTTSSSRRLASFSIRSTLSGVLAWKNENRSCGSAGTAVRMARIVASVTRVIILNLGWRAPDPGAGLAAYYRVPRTDRQPPASVEPEAGNSVLISVLIVPALVPPAAGQLATGAPGAGPLPDCLAAPDSLPLDWHRRRGRPGACSRHRDAPGAPARRPSELLTPRSRHAQKHEHRPEVFFASSSSCLRVRLSASRSPRSTAGPPTA